METPQNPMENQPFNNVDEGKNIAIIAYLTIIGLIIAFVLNNEKKNEFARFHIRQSLGIFITLFAVSIVSYIPYIGWIIAIAGVIIGVIMWVIGIMNAANGKQKVVPILGEQYNTIFAGI
ncbi:DUF4870 domain-containing protein [Sphingobacteruim zhuxiongii]|nr:MULTISPECIES: hypothetical protein [unclassified Sphingobacterium]